MKKILGFVALLASLCSPAMSQTQTAIRIKCAGPSYTDAKGQIWQQDFGFNSGSVSAHSANIAGTVDQPLYQTGRRNDNSSAPLIYSIPLANGKYHVNLYFAETYVSNQHKDMRVFAVAFQDKPVFPALDIFEEAGASAALIKSADVMVSNGVLKISFTNIVDHAKVNAIEIVPGSSGPSLKLSFQYPDGKPVIGKLSYSISSPLLTFQGSVPLANGQADCVLLANPSQLGISTQFQVKLSLSDDVGHSLWGMNLGMNPSDINLNAVQSSLLNVIVQKM